MKVYLAGSIAGGQKYARGIRAIADFLKAEDHKIMTPFVIDLYKNKNRFVGTAEDQARQIFLDDMRRLDESDLLIAEVSQASTGVGMEIGVLLGAFIYAGVNKPILCLMHRSLEGEKHSKLPMGIRYNGWFSYYTDLEIPEIVGEFIKLAQEGREGGIFRERG